MAYRCPDAKVLGSARLNGYQLLFRGGKAGSVAMIEKRKGGSVPVLLWEITARDEEALDRYEGYPALYRKETVKVRLGGQWVPAMVYIMNEGRPLGIPSRYYYDIIWRGYAEAGLETAALSKAVQESAVGA